MGGGQRPFEELLNARPPYTTLGGEETENKRRVAGQGRSGRPAPFNRVAEHDEGESGGPSLGGHWLRRRLRMAPCHGLF